ncbi:MAG: hypothetical protein B6226_01320 [Candidatus Cloacimonetes bacterium 4572_65]|nr:MAG: hypothetical protein B6226_01320 [Candidatus Cloacimonetes bacterium 4572_65]
MAILLFVLRFLAMCIDVGLIYGIYFVFFILLKVNIFFPNAWIPSITFISWLYYSLSESSRNQATLGKFILGLKVTDLSGSQVGFIQATIRYFMRMVSGSILLIGFIMALFTRKNQTLHDLVSGSLVSFR